ncbi:MAG TPA: hypothetical protein VMC83_00330 [Streptosporangiaceae bacterium]|nr:hypothetical protein [Streptosporangiaceae bacterium]
MGATISAAADISGTTLIGWRAPFHSPGSASPTRACRRSRTASSRKFSRTSRFAADAGLSPPDAARELDLGPCTDWLDRERIVGNLHRALAELGSAPPGTPIDLPAALTDMVAYNGGQPLTSYA